MSSPAPDAVPTALALLSQTCTASVSALSTQRPQPSPPPLPALRKDLLALLILIYSHTTKLSIALNPASPTLSAALSPLKELTILAGTLASNVTSFDPQIHGSAISDEVHALAKNVLFALGELAATHLGLLKPNLSKSKPKAGSRAKDGAGEQYLIRTGAVHDLITRAQKDLSDSNLTAVKKKWKATGEIIDDTVVELDEDAEDDEGWDDPELDFRFNTKKNAAEQSELTATLRALLKRVSTLYALIPTLLLRPPPTQSTSPSKVASSSLASPIPNTVLEALLATASPLSNAIDELVSRVYDPEDLLGARDEFVAALRAVGGAVDAIFIHRSGEDSGGDGDGSKTVKKGGQEWFLLQFSALEETAMKIGLLDESDAR